MKKIKSTLTVLLVFISLLAFNSALAQGSSAGNNGNSGNGNGNNGNGNGNGASLPIDGSIVLLLIAGTIMGIMVVRNATKTVKA